MSKNVSRKQIARALVGLMNASSNRQGLSRTIAAYLINERRTKELDSLMRDVMQLRYDHDDVLELEVSSAHALNDQIKAEIAHMFPAGVHVLHEQSDPSIIAGILIETVDQSLDATVKNRLRKLTSLAT